MPKSLEPIRRAYAETGALNAHVAPLCFWDDRCFVTKGGDVGLVLQVTGLDYECLDGTALDHAARRAEAAFKVFDEGFRVYQYLFKRSRPEIAHRFYGHPVLDEAIAGRLAHLAKGADRLFEIDIHYAILFTGGRTAPTLRQALARFPEDPRRAMAELRGLISARKQVRLVAEEVDRAAAFLRHKADSFVRQLEDVCPMAVLPKGESFRFLKRLINFTPHKLKHARLAGDGFLDYALCDSSIDCYRGHLRVDDYAVKALTLKEPTSGTFPLVLQGLFEVEADFFVCTEWQRRDSFAMRREIQKKRRHYHSTKTSLKSQLNLSEKANPDLLVDDGKAAVVADLGAALTEMELEGRHFGAFSLTVVLFDADEARLARSVSDFYKVFSAHDAMLHEERPNLLNAFLACVPGNMGFNLRTLYILNSNYADYAFLFTLRRGDPVNRHLGAEYLAVLESEHRTPYYLNLHHQDLAHTVVLGKSGSGKSFLLNFLITFLQKYGGDTFIFDLGGSYRSLNRLFGGAYLKVGAEGGASINPFCLPPNRENLHFLVSFLRVLMEEPGRRELSSAEERELFDAVENLYDPHVAPELRTLSTLKNLLPPGLKGGLDRWTRGGHFGFLFDNPEDTVSLASFQVVEFEGMENYPRALEPLLYYVLHRAGALIADPARTGVFKAFVIDEAWRFFQNAAVRAYIVEALKTWRKKNAAMILATQSVDELRKSDIMDVVLESCATKLFLANPDGDPALYAELFRLNEREVETIAGLVPKRQFLMVRPDESKVLNLNVDPLSRWLYTSDPLECVRREAAVAEHGLKRGLEILARS